MGNPNAKPNCFGDYMARQGTPRMASCQNCPVRMDCKSDQGRSRSPEYMLRTYGVGSVGAATPGGQCQTCQAWESFYSHVVQTVQATNPQFATWLSQVRQSVGL